MADIFISCSPLDVGHVRPLTERLLSLGYSVSWERGRRPELARALETEEALDRAKAVIAVWSHNARNSVWTIAEASHAHDKGKLLQVVLDGAPPTPFDRLPATPLRDERTEWAQLEAELEKRVRQGVDGAPTAPVGLRVFDTPAALGSSKTLTFAVSATLAAFAAALSATVNERMTPDQLEIALTGVLGVGCVAALIAAYRLSATARAEG